MKATVGISNSFILLHIHYEYMNNFVFIFLASISILSSRIIKSFLFTDLFTWIPKGTSNCAFPKQCLISSSYIAVPQNSPSHWLTTKSIQLTWWVIVFYVYMIWALKDCSNHTRTIVNIYTLNCEALPQYTYTCKRALTNALILQWGNGLKYMRMIISFKIYLNVQRKLCERSSCYDLAVS